MTDETRTWNDWNTASNREHALSQVQRAQAAQFEGWLDRGPAAPLRILEVGCGTGWMVDGSHDTAA